MQVEFKYPRKINGVHFSPGIYQLSKDVTSNRYFKALLKDKDVRFVDEEGKPIKKKKKSEGLEEKSIVSEKEPS